MCHELRLGDHGAGPLHEQNEDVERAASDGNGLVPLEEAPLQGEEPKRAELGASQRGRLRLSCGARVVVAGSTRRSAARPLSRNAAIGCTNADIRPSIALQTA
jgi:hypothetical protein